MSQLMNQRLKGRRILVTGGSRGIGAGIARRLASEGAQVAITYSSSEAKARAVVSDLPGEGHNVCAMNVADESSVKAGFSEILTEWGGLDGLVNNAGITQDQLLLRMKSEQFDAVISTNLRGTFLCTREALKPLLKSPAPAIVNISSVIGHTGNAGQANYSASKAGIEAFSRSVALEMASRKIRVNCVAPGFIVTEMTNELNEAQKASIMSRIPLGTLGKVSDVAACVAFLLSDEAEYITGQTLAVNGGLSM